MGFITRPANNGGNKPFDASAILAKGLEQMGINTGRPETFDTLCLKTDGATKSIAARAVSAGVNVRIAWDDYICISLDETTTRDDDLVIDGEAIYSSADSLVIGTLVDGVILVVAIVFAWGR